MYAKSSQFGLGKSSQSGRLLEVFPAELLAAQKDAGIDMKQAVTKGSGEVVHLMKADGVLTAVKAIGAAFAQFMRDHYEGVRSSESINRDSLTLSGYVIDDKQQVCSTCSRMFLRGHQHPSRRRHCCDNYDSATRNRLMVVVGYSLERVPLHGPVGLQGADGL